MLEEAIYHSSSFTRFIEQLSLSRLKGIASIGSVGRDSKEGFTEMFVCGAVKHQFPKELKDDKSLHEEKMSSVVLQTPTMHLQ
jgi:hypothetical protein